MPATPAWPPSHRAASRTGHPEWLTTRDATCGHPRDLPRSSILRRQGRPPRRGMGPRRRGQPAPPAHLSACSAGKTLPAGRGGQDDAGGGRPHMSRATPQRSLMLTEDMKRLVSEQRLGFVATVCPDGNPSLSPKGTTAIWDDDHIVFADIRSPA